MTRTTSNTAGATAHKVSDLGGETGFNATERPNQIHVAVAPTFHNASTSKRLPFDRVVSGLRNKGTPVADKTLGPIIHFAKFPNGAPKRELAICEGASAIVLDFDGRNGDRVSRADAESTCELFGVSFISWNTFSSTPDDDFTFRLVLPVEDLIPIGEYKGRTAQTCKTLGITPPGKLMPASQGFFFSPKEGGLPQDVRSYQGATVCSLWGAYEGEIEEFETVRREPEFPLTEKQVAEARAVIAQMRDAGLHLTNGKGIWHQVIGALANYGEVGANLCHEFSVGDSKYSPKDVERKIRDKLKSGATGIGRLFEIAAENGIENPATHTRTCAEDDFSTELGKAEEEWATPVGLEAIEYTLDGFLSAGVTYIAGGHGIGKSSLLVPLASIVSGELPAFEQSIGAMLQRKVVYITEDPSQARRIRYGLKKHNGLVENGHFRIVGAKRRNAGEVELMMEATVKAHTITGPNGYPVKPLVVFDTTNACFEIENENDAAEVGRVMSALKQSGAPVWIIGHLAKAIARDDIAAMTGRGSGAWEADAQGTAFIFAEDEATDVRYLATKKRRFEPSYIEVKYITRIDHEVVVAPWGEEQRIGFRYGVPERASPGQRREEAANRQLEGDVAELLRYLGGVTGEGVSVSKNTIENDSGIPKRRVRAALEKAVERGLVANDGKYIVGNNQERHDGYYVKTLTFDEVA